VNARKELAEGRDILAPDVTLMNGQIADYIRERRSSTTRSKSSLNRFSAQLANESRERIETSMWPKRE